MDGKIASTWKLHHMFRIHVESLQKWWKKTQLFVEREKPPTMKCLDRYIHVLKKYLSVSLLSILHSC